MKMASPVSSPDFDASLTLASSLMDQINKEDVNNMVSTQRDMLSRFEKTNEMLINFNILSANRFAVTSQEYKKHTQLMYEMKKDLDSIFKRIRSIKNRLGKSYPEAFKVCKTTTLLEDEEGEEEQEVSRSGSTSSASQSSVAETQSRGSHGQTGGKPTTEGKPLTSKNRDSDQNPNSGTASSVKESSTIPHSSDKHLSGTHSAMKSKINTKEHKQTQDHDNDSR